MKNRLNQFLLTAKRFGKNTSGVAAVEFGIIAPVFFIIVGIILEVALLLFLEYAIQGGVQDASRAVRTGHAQGQQWSKATLRDKICNFAIIISDCKTELKVYVNSANNFTALTAAVPAVTTIGVSGAAIPFNCGNSQMAVAVIAIYDHKMMMPGMSFFANFDNKTARRIIGYSLFRNEPFPPTTSCT